MRRDPDTPRTAYRMLRYAWRIYAGGELTTRWMRERFGLSPMTASRDMNEVIAALPVKLARPRRQGVERRVLLAKTEVRNLFDE